MSYLKISYIQTGIFLTALIISIAHLDIATIYKLPIPSEYLNLIFPAVIVVCSLISWKMTPIIHKGLLQFEIYKKMNDEDCMNQCLRLIESRGVDKKLIAKKILDSVTNNNHH